MKNILYTLICFLLTTGVFAQESEIKELKKRLASLPDDTTRCYILNELAELTGDDEWPEYNQQLFDFAEGKLKGLPKSHKYYRTYKRYLAESINNKGFLKLQQGKPKEALSYFFQSQQLHNSIGNEMGEAVVLNNIGAIYENQGDIPKALEFYYRSLEIKERKNNREGIAGSLNNIGLIYSSLGDDDNALKAFERCLKFEKELKDKEGEARVYYNIGYIYTRQKNYSKAQEYIQRSLKLFRELNDPIGISYNLRNLGETYETQGKIDLAYTNYAESLKLRRKVDDKKGMSSSLYNLANLEFKRNNFDESKKYALESYAIASELGYPDVMRNASGQLYLLYKRDGDYRRALDFLEMSKKMNDSIYNIESKNKSTRNQLNYQFSRKEDRIREQQEKKELIFKNQAKNQRIIIVFSLAIIVFTLVFLYVLYRRFKVSQHQRRLIALKELETQRQKDLVEQKNHEILDSIQYARRIQSAILPSTEFITNLVPHSFVVYQPKDIVAGDFYWFDRIDNKLFFACADCTGHGVPGALVSVVCHNALNRSIREFKLRKSGEILDKTREIVIDELCRSDKEVRDGMDISIGVLDLDTHLLYWSGANNPIWIIRNGEIMEWKANKQPIGYYYNMENFTTHEIQLQRNDLLYCFSDGYQDQFGGESGKKYKITRLREQLLSIHQLDMHVQHELLVNNLTKWMGETEQVDDVCIVGIRY